MFSCEAADNKIITNEEADADKFVKEMKCMFVFCTQLDVSHAT